MSEKLATLKKEENISIITLDDGKANVFSSKMSKDINAVSYTHLTLPTTAYV